VSQVVSGIDVIVSTLQASDFADFAKGITTNHVWTFRTRQSRGTRTSPSDPARTAQPPLNL